MLSLFPRPYGKLGQWNAEAEGLLRTWLLDESTQPLTICDSAESTKPLAICDSAKADESSSDESSSDESSSQSDESAEVGSDDKKDFDKADRGSGGDGRASWSTEQWMAHCTDLEDSLASMNEAFENEEEENANLRRRIDELSAENEALQHGVKRKKQH